MRHAISALRLFLPLLFLPVAPALAQVPQVISHQGVLTDNGGNLVPDGNYSLTTRLFTVETGGTAIFTETQSVPIVKGGYNLLIGSVVTLPASTSFAQPLWLEVQVAPDPAPLSPRIRLTSSPFALMAQKVLPSSVTSTEIATNAVGTSEIVNGSILDADVNASAAIQATKIFGDVGLDHSNRITVTDVPTSLTNVLSTTLSCPTAGNVLLFFTGDAVFFGDNTKMAATISTAADGSGKLAELAMGRLDGTTNDRYEIPFTAVGIAPVAAGDRTFYANLQVSPVFSAHQVNVVELRLVGVFVPKSY